MSEDSDVGKVADAAKEIAKTSGKVVDATSSLASFLGRVLGGAVEDTVGLFGDSLNAFRTRRAADLQVKTESHLAKKGLVVTAPVSTRIAYRIIDQASLEDNENLHDLFARLLAEALDPGGEMVTIEYCDVVEKLTSDDIRVLDYCWRYRDSIGLVMGDDNVSYQKVPRNGVWARRSAAEFKAKLGIEPDATRRLVGLGLFKHAVKQVAAFDKSIQRIGEVPLDSRFVKVTVQTGEGDVELTEFGKSFLRAVVAPPQGDEGDAGSGS